MDGKNNMSIVRLDSCAGSKLLSLVSLAIIILGCAAPAHADNISIDFDTATVNLQRSGNIYKHNSSVRVRNSNTYGFTLSMNASQPNLVNNKDSSYKIVSVSGTNQHLAANQWGYGMGKNATTFSSVSSATLADVTRDSKGSCTEVDDCTLYLTLGANIDPKRLPVGNYSTTLTYTATSKPAPYAPPAPDPEPYVPPEPYIPPAPTWTTNGCKSLYSWKGDYDNCLLFFGTYYSFEYLVAWTGSEWKTNGYAGVDYSDGRWLLGSTDIDIYTGATKDDLRVAAYVPRFSKTGYYIRFCKDSTSTGCTDSDVEPAFAGSKLGFWISLTRLGCTEHVRSGAYGDTSYNAYLAAETLIEAFGSPCPE